MPPRLPVAATRVSRRARPAAWWLIQKRADFIRILILLIVPLEVPGSDKRGGFVRAESIGQNRVFMTMHMVSVNVYVIGVTGLGAHVY